VLLLHPHVRRLDVPIFLLELVRGARFCAWKDEKYFVETARSFPSFLTGKVAQSVVFCFCIAAGGMIEIASFGVYNTEDLTFTPKLGHWV
jgi:hypothetical protein